MKNGLVGIVVLVVVVVVLLWVLKLALRLVVLAVLVGGAIALFYAVRNRIGGPHA